MLLPLLFLLIFLLLLLLLIYLHLTLLLLLLLILPLLRLPLPIPLAAPVTKHTLPFRDGTMALQRLVHSLGSFSTRDWWISFFVIKFTAICYHKEVEYL